MRHIIKGLNGRLLSVALSSAVITAFFTLATGLYLGARENARQRAMLCHAAQQNRQVLRDLIDLIGPSEFRAKAQRIVNRPIPCEQLSD